MVKRVLLLLLLSCPLAFSQEFDWTSLPTGRWVPIPTVGEAAPKIFHGGATIIPDKHLVVFFGSDTHAPTPLENGESNAVWRLDLQNLCWSQDYQQDPKSTYRILPDGQAETSTGRPWAMHTFASVDWDPQARRIVVVSGPIHARFEPEERFPMFTEHEWWLRLKSSHWEYDPDTRNWRRFAIKAPAVFAGATVWDSRRSVLVSHNGSLTWEFDRERSVWREFPSPSKPGWHQNTVFDTYAGRILLLGNNSSDANLYSYDPDQHAWSVLPTEGRPLPANGAAIAYDTRNQVMLYLANDFENQYHNPSGAAVTFLFHSRSQRWERLTVESPELFGMNYLMQYDPVRNVFLHFEKSEDSGDRVSVWAFRFR